MIKATPAKYLGQVFATNEAEAIKEAAKEFNVAENLHDRIVARQEDYCGGGIVGLAKFT